MLSDLLFRLRSLFRRKVVEAELEDELYFHAEHQLQKYVSSGMNRDQAARRVRLEFGGVGQIKEDCRDARGVSFVETFLQDLRYGCRTLLKSPGFTFVALFTLALGIGANTAIFSVVYGILLRPLPFRDASRLVILNETTPKVGNVSVSYPNFLDWRSQSHAFSEMSAVYGAHFNLAGISQPENISGLAVSPNFFSMMGIRPVLGRPFTAAEEKAGTAPVLILSYSLWQSHFGGDPNVLGRSVQLDSTSYTIVGVLPPQFRWLEQADVIEPVGVWATGDDSLAERGERSDMIVAGRLAGGTSFAQARTEMESIAARLAREYPGANDQFGVALRPLRESFSGDIRPAILVLLGAAIFVLLVACANVANLFLMRGAVRSREMALRIAIGASRGRIVRQILTESLIVAVSGGLCGVGIAVAGIPAIARVISEDMLAGASIGLNGAVLLFSAVLVFLSMLVFGLGPALNATSGEVQPQLQEGGKATSAGARSRWRSALATVEVALALVLLIGAGLMVKSLYRLMSVDSGFRPESVVKLEMSLRTAQYDKTPAVLNFWQRVLDGVRVLPGVQSAAVGSNLPLTDSHWRTDIWIEGTPIPAPGSFPHPDMHVVSAGYVHTLGMRLLRGRTFVESDGENAPPVAIVNSTIAQKLFPGQDPVGKRFEMGRPRPDRPTKWLTIVGVVSDTKMYGLANPARMEVYLPFRQRPQGSMSVVVRTANDPAAIISAVRAVVASLDKDQPIFAIQTMQEVIAKSVSMRRITLMLLGLFAGLALALAAVGIYGVISYSVAQRAREIGIRVALGAQRGDVLRLVLAQGGRIAAAGIAAGALAALGLTRMMSKLLYSVSAVDPTTFVVVALALASVALLACYIPARRTLRADPLIALRHE